MKAFALVAARDLLKGDTVRFGERGACPIEDIAVDASKIVSGGEPYKSAMAVKIVLTNGKTFFVHPGSEIYAIRR